MCRLAVTNHQRCIDPLLFQPSMSTYNTPGTIASQTSGCALPSNPAPSKYVPQYDEQLQSPMVSSITPDDHNEMDHPDIPNTLEYHYCSDCELNWLVGFDRLVMASLHPSHPTLCHDYSGQTKRSLVVHIDSVIPPQSPQKRESAFGMCFGPRSKHNIASIVPSRHATHQFTDLSAAIASLRHVRTRVWPEREAIVRADAGSHTDLTWLDGWTTPSADLQRGILNFRLILATNASCVVSFACDKRHTWILDAANRTFRGREGRPLKNGALFAKLDGEIQALSHIGVQIQWYVLPRTYHYHADRLAWGAIAGLVLPEEGPEDDEFLQEEVFDTDPTV